ncbi:hypothetical protein DIZ76_013013 [Coccidioides immitis]|nr:hypothetical protein DIZ76_013013 [Coccidioides immitis]
MPIKWTPENDQILLLKILETHQLSVDTKKVSEAWPQADPNAIPTPRAITERLHRIKKASKENIESLAATPKKLQPRRSRLPTLPARVNATAWLWRGLFRSALRTKPS